MFIFPHKAVVSQQVPNSKRVPVVEVVMSHVSSVFNTRNHPLVHPHATSCIFPTFSADTEVARRLV